MPQPQPPASPAPPALAGSAAAPIGASAAAAAAHGAEGGIFSGMLGQTLAFSPPMMMAASMLLQPMTLLFQAPWSPVKLLSDGVCNIIDSVGGKLFSGLKTFLTGGYHTVTKREYIKKLHSANLQLYAAASKWPAQDIKQDRKAKGYDSFRNEEVKGEKWMKKYLSEHSLEELDRFMEDDFFAKSLQYQKAGLSPEIALNTPAAYRIVETERPASPSGLKRHLISYHQMHFPEKNNKTEMHEEAIDSDSWDSILDSS